MDEQLAQIYGTNQSYDNEDLEKTAAAELLVKLAEEQGVDLNEFSDEDIAEMIGELYSEKTAEEKKEEPKKEEKKEEEAKEKVAEADYLGRVMAHAMVQEINNIEKEAGALPFWKTTNKEHVSKALEAAKGGGKKALEWVKGRPKAYGEAGSELKKAFGKSELGEHLPQTKTTIKERLHALGRAAKKVAPEAGVAAAGTAAGIAAHKMHKKEASALETLAEKRAYDMLSATGWVDEQGNLIAPQVEETKEASAIEQEVDTMALQLLEANGYPVEWNQ